MVAGSADADGASIYDLHAMRACGVYDGVVSLSFFIRKVCSMWMG